MFGTWKVDSQQKEPQFVQYANAASAINTNSWNCPHIACDICRSRKLKCSGEPTGCKRCRSMRISCTYPSAQETRRRKRNSQPAEARQPSKPALGSRKASEATITSQHALGPVDQTTKDDVMEEYGQDSLVNWLTPTDSSVTSPQKEGRTSAQDWSNMLNDIDNFTDAWSHLPGEIPTPDEFSISMLNTANDSSTTSADRAPTQPIQVHHFSGTPSSTPLGPTDFDLESPLPAQKVSLIPQSASANSTQARIVDLDDDGSCQCLKLAACLLEELSTQIACVTTTMMDELLSQYEAATRKVSHLLRCSKCASHSENMMLLAMIGQHICTICEKVTYGYLHQSGSKTHDMWFGSYKIKAESEKNHLLKSLILLELKDFSSLLDKLKVRAASLKAQMALLQEAERKVQKLGWLIKRSDKSMEDTSLVS